MTTFTHVAVGSLFVLILTACGGGESSEPAQAAANSDQMIEWRGDWQADESYELNDVVNRNGRAYIYVLAATGSEDPLDNGHWELMVDRGETGPIGPQGIAGADGVAGPTGSTGPTGPQGMAGADGATGPASLEWQGEYTGGNIYRIDDVVSFNGSSYVSIQNTTGVENPSDASFWELLAEKGTDGNAGPQGPAGVDGIDGATGPQGVAGADGAVGPTGSTGSQGVAGADGAVGPTGPTGDPGAQGIQGERGLDWQGSWSSSTAYLIDDVVEFEGSAYIAVQDTTGAESPADPTYWDLLVRASASGQAFALQGFSSGLASGNGGYTAINGVCESEFGSGSRIATTDEVLRSTGLVAGSGQAWVNGVRTGTLSATYGRYQLRGAGNCGGFVTNYYGTSVDRSSLVFASESCSSSLSVACAALEPAVDYRFQGFSGSTMSGASGVLAMNAECIASFGVGARMATTEETVNAPVLVNQVGKAWVRPIRSQTNSNNDEFTGQTFTNCSDWSYGSTTGLTVDGATFVYSTSSSCSVGAKVACSAP